MRRLVALLLLMMGGLAARPAEAQREEPLAAAAQSLIALFNGAAEPERLFSPAFLAQVPFAQVKGIATQLRSQLGSATRIDRIEPRGAQAGTVFLEFERGTLQLNLAVDPQPPHLIQGLLVVGSQAKDDSFAKIIDELESLPGRASLAVARLGDGPPVPLARHAAAEPMAVGSAFKLLILAELDRSIRAGERRWSDAAPLTHHSLPSGLLQDWPIGSPLTLHSLAALMIAQSDNSATDTLLHLLGREKVEAVMGTVEVKAPNLNRPFLSTMEAFALKGGDPALAEAWLTSGEAKRRALLKQLAGIVADRIDIARLNAQPNLIDSVEWFLAAEDLVRVMDWLRRNGTPETLGILAINGGLARSNPAFTYAGYKGGSETGVIAMTYLVRDHRGSWHALAAGWNNPAAQVDEDRFSLLMTRAISLIAARPPS